MTPEPVPQDREPDAMKSGTLVLEVLDAVVEHQPVGVSEIARLVGRPKTSVQRALVTLHRSGWIRTPGPDDQRWVVALKAVRVAGALASANLLREAARPTLLRLRDLTGESVILCEREDDDWVVIDDVESTQAVRVVHSLGIRSPLHAGASGEVILAHLPSSSIEAYLRKPLRPMTSSTITDPSRLRSVLDEIRTRGYAATSNETSGGLAGVAAVIVRGGAPIGSLAVSLPMQRYTPQAVGELGPVIQAHARAISDALG